MSRHQLLNLLTRVDSKLSGSLTIAPNLRASIQVFSCVEAVLDTRLALSGHELEVQILLSAPRTFGVVAQLVRALACQVRGRGFEPRLLRQIIRV